MTVTKTPALTEKQWQEQVLRLAGLHGFHAYHTHDSRRSQPGFPDLVLVKGGRLIFAELKTETGKTSLAQDVWLEALDETPAEVYLWRPSDLEMVQRVLADRAVA